MSLEIDLKGKVALITGVSSGIGAALATMFARAGADVAGCDRDLPGKAFSALGEKYGIKSKYFTCDVSDQEGMTAFVEQVTATFGKIDILVSNAGYNFFEGATACTTEHWDSNIAVNLSAHWRLAKLCKPSLEQQGGVIILMSSNHAFATIPGCFPYNIAKTAITGLVRSLAIEWGPAIRTVGLAPGFIDTPGNKQWFDSFADPGQERARTIALHPVKRLGTPEEVAAWCVFLASEYGAFASGTTYLLDGGRSALMQDVSY